MRDDIPSNGQVNLDDTGYWARWATWQARAKQRHVTAIADGSTATPAMFVSNEVLVGREDQDAIGRLVAAGGKVVPARDMAEPPPEIVARDDVADFPLPVMVRFDEPPTIDEPIRRLARAYENRDIERRPPLSFTSDAGARVATLVAELQADGHDADLNWLGSPDALPLASATELWTSDNDPFNWASHAGRSRIVDGWELVEAFRAQRSLKSIVWIAVLDGGFWLNNGVSASGDLPGFGLDIASDTVAAAGGSNPNNCGKSSCPWHGNGVASAAAAAVNNNLGVAGAGGTVARLVFFKTTISEDEVFKCLRYCTAWGLDVLNMSFAMKRVELFFGTSSWNNAFQFAIDHGVIPVAAAGNGDSNNVGQELPDYNVRPATRTPGTITVGALDQADQAASFSNFGSSVNIWAPGVGIPVGPDPANPNGSAPSGTSQAAPLVAGVVAMMRAVNPGIDSGTARTMLSDTGWQGTGRVTKGLDAYGAVLAAMGGSLPKDLSEPNNSPSTASLLMRLAPGGPLRTYSDVTTIAAGDADYYRLNVGTLSSATVTLEWYRRLGTLGVQLTPDDKGNQASVDALTTTYGPPGRATITGVLAPGGYVIAVQSNRPNGYSVNAAVAPLMLAADMFEANDSFDSAAIMRLQAPTSLFGYLVGWGPGRYDCTLHEVAPGGVNADYFELQTPRRAPLTLPFVEVNALDAPLNVWLYDSAQVQIAQWPQGRNVRFAPPADAMSYLRIEGSSQTRYELELGLEVDRDALPKPHMRPFSPIPDWWEGPWEGRLRNPEQYWSVNVQPREIAGRHLAFETAGATIRLTLLDVEGNDIREATRDGDLLTIDTEGLDRGVYLVRAIAEDVSVPPLLRNIRPEY